MVDLLGDPDIPFRFFVGDLIIRNAKGALDALLEAAETAPEENRRSIAHLLGKIGRRLDEARLAPVKKVLECVLQDEDPKTRRNAAIALGTLESESATGALIAALEAESFDWVRPSLILALGQIGGSESIAFLGDFKPECQAEVEAHVKAMDRVGGTEREPRPPIRTLGAERLIELHCAPGQEGLLCDAIKRSVGERPSVVQNGAVRVRLQELIDLQQIRTWREWLVCVGERPIDADSVDRVGLDLLADGLALVSEIYREDPLTRYRLEIRGKSVSHRQRKRRIKVWSEGLKARAPAYVNSPSHYEVETRILLAKTKVGVFLKLTEEADSRFGYRVQDVPASMHPAVAAGVVAHSRPVSKGRVLDPFCGCGTLLFERAQCSTAAGHLVGSDISGSAIDAARTNLRQFEDLPLRFRRGDVGSVTHDGPFDELISNLPYGIRTGSHQKNIASYAALFDRLSEWLKPEARLTLVTQEIEMMTRLFRDRRDVHLDDVARVDVSGLQPGVFKGCYGQKK